MEPFAVDQTVRDYLWTRIGTFGEMVQSATPAVLTGGVLCLMFAAVLSCCWGAWRTGPRSQ